MVFAITKTHKLHTSFECWYSLNVCLKYLFLSPRTFPPHLWSIHLMLIHKSFEHFLFSLPFLTFFSSLLSLLFTPHTPLMRRKNPENELQLKYQYRKFQG